MWAPLGHKHYILKKERFEDGCDIYVSNFVHLWHKRLKDNEIATVFKKMNPLIEAPELKLVEKVLSLFDEDVTTNKILDEKGDYLIFHLESNLSDIKFHFKLELELQNAEMFFKEVTLPFMFLAARFQIREKKLTDIILKKDAEINEYRRENVLIKRSHLITKEFNRSELMEGELEESASSFAAIMNNPSTILNFIDVAMFESGKSHNVKQNGTIVEKIVKNSDNSSLNEIDSKKNKKTDLKPMRNKSKIELHKNLLAKKKRENCKINLKL